jgi:hypothetical protein
MANRARSGKSKLVNRRMKSPKTARRTTSKRRRLILRSISQSKRLPTRFAKSLSRIRLVPS